MNRRLQILCILICTILNNVCARTDSLRLKLEEALVIGQKESLISLENRNRLHISYWQLKNYRASLSPSVTLYGTLPSLNRSLSSYQEDGGTYKFIPNNYIRETIGLTVSQAIPFTGGQINVQSNIERIDQLSGDNGGNFLSVPVNVILSQSLLSYNPYRWSKRIEPLRYEVEIQDYIASVEQVNISTVSHYFNLLFSQVNKAIAYQNKKNAEELYRIALGKKSIGLMSENDLLQLEIGVLNANAEVVNAEQQYSSSMHALRNYLGYGDNIELIPVMPNEKYIQSVDYDGIRELAQENNPVYKNLIIRLLEAERNVAQAKSDYMPNVEMYLSFGLTGSEKMFTSAYHNLQNRSLIELTFNIPILDWGKRKGKLALARAQQELVENQIEREQNDFNERVRELFQQTQDQSLLVNIFRRADTIAQQRYKIAFDKFTFGTATVLEINSAQEERDNAKRNYINQLYLSWYYFFNLRYITLYDFGKMEKISTYF